MKQVGDRVPSLQNSPPLGGGTGGVGGGGGGVGGGVGGVGGVGGGGTGVPEPTVMCPIRCSEPHALATLSVIVSLPEWEPV